MENPEAVLIATAEIRVFAPPGLLVMVDVLRLIDLVRPPDDGADSGHDAELAALPTLSEAVRQLEQNYDSKRMKGGVPISVRVRVTPGEAANLLETKKPARGGKK